MSEKMSYYMKRKLQKETTQAQIQVQVQDKVIESVPVIEIETTVEPEKKEIVNLPSTAEKAQYKKKIDRLATIRTQMKELSDADDLLKGDICKFMQKYNLEIVRTEEAEAKVVEKTNRTVDADEYYKLVGLQKFIQSVKVKITDAKRFVSNTVLSTIASTNTSHYVKVGVLRPDKKKIVYF